MHKLIFTTALLAAPLALETLLEEVPILDFDRRAADANASLPFRRSSFDQRIAAHALSMNLILVTDNLLHFRNVTNLQVENWTV